MRSGQTAGTEDELQRQRWMALSDTRLSVRLPARSSAETLEAKKEWNNIFQELKKKPISHEYFLLSYKIEREIRTSGDKQKQRS